ncbi:unnamed protein product [Vitrella brassicaformis CCMP3155]|uniref:Uncharacterized protein n=1 Tax=Vitrella brassicaformis (strain CCMP3155) TaxID=1169540 RepID=A0A0G4H6E9_VITBC|nr:unnamed protein product [Vitrella brassicaformis CCMP3155]|mmetsp:Transcript_50321/g.126054  ORF Transcript_50321/g.126054 Transcript_50321/m.126054 type:complete len:287 (-) Transcript_50321:493-1353(-)|eukprot:CEM39189.1 unnamed protein product [Vitrella brassicaformis CCMP3155]
MAVRILSTFFPDLFKWTVKRIGLDPQAVVDDSCPLPVLQLGDGAKVDWPLLMPVVVSGVIISLFLACDLFSKGRQLMATRHGDFVHYWATSHLCYAVMNASAIFVHCLDDTISDFWVEQMTIVDVTATACSSSSFIFASITYRRRANGGRKGPYLLLRLVHLALFGVFIAIGESQRPFTREFLWIGVTSVSVIFVYTRDVICALSPVLSHTRKWLVLALLSVFTFSSLMLLGVFGHRCGIVSQAAMPLGFFGHNVGMMCLWCYARMLIDYHAEALHGCTHKGAKGG